MWPSLMAMMRSLWRTAASRWAMMITVRPLVIERMLAWMMRSLS
jgi:hypothetical protein